MGRSLRSWGTSVWWCTSPERYIKCWLRPCQIYHEILIAFQKWLDLVHLCLMPIGILKVMIADTVVSPSRPLTWWAKANSSPSSSTTRRESRGWMVLMGLNSMRRSTKKVGSHKWSLENSNSMSFEQKVHLILTMWIPKTEITPENQECHNEGQQGARRGARSDWLAYCGLWSAYLSLRGCAELLPLPGGSKRPDSRNLLERHLHKAGSRRIVLPLASVDHRLLVRKCGHVVCPICEPDPPVHPSHGHLVLNDDGLELCVHLQDVVDEESKGDNQGRARGRVERRSSVWRLAGLSFRSCYRFENFALQP